MISIPIHPSLLGIARNVTHIREVKIAILRTLVLMSVAVSHSLRTDDLHPLDLNRYEFPDGIIERLDAAHVELCCSLAGTELLDILARKHICVPYVYLVNETVLLIEEQENHRV